MDKLGNKVYLFFPPEEDEGCIEYKWNLTKLKKNKWHKIASQMNWRVRETTEEQSALYIIGVHDNGAVTGLDKENLIETYIVLLDCARSIGLYMCLRKLGRIKTNRDDYLYWAVIQIFKSDVKIKDIRYDHDLPVVPEHPIPNYTNYGEDGDTK